MILRTGNAILILALLLGSCDLIDFKEQNAGLSYTDPQRPKPLARAHDKYLYFFDLEGLVPDGISETDSADLVKRYVKTWIDKQLAIEEASRKLKLDEAEIERKVLDYRYALLIHEYQKSYINDNLNMDVSDREIENYYNQNRDNFKLRHHIIKCRFVKLPLEAPKLSVFRRLFRTNDEKQLEELKSYCYQYSTTFHLDTIWVNFDVVLENTPLVAIENKISFLRNNRYYETRDDVYYYFLNISDYKISEEISPLEWVRDDIQKIILNKRKVDLAKDLEEGIYSRAEKNEDFEIYIE